MTEDDAYKLENTPYSVERLAMQPGRGGVGDYCRENPMCYRGYSNVGPVTIVELHPGSVYHIVCEDERDGTIISDTWKFDESPAGETSTPSGGKVGLIRRLFLDE